MMAKDFAYNQTSILRMAIILGLRSCVRNF